MARTFHWDFGDGTTADGPFLSHAFPGPGTYAIGLTISEDAPPPPPPPSPDPGDLRINAGGGAYTDRSGNLWSADSAYSGGKTFSTNDPITNTENDLLYRSERYGTFGYQFDLPNGTYAVVLHFAEIFHTASGKRIFDVFIEGAVVLDHYDIYADVGHDAAVTHAFQAVVQDSRLTLQFNPIVDKAKISAIEVRKVT